MVIWNTLLIRKALTKAVTKANPSSTLRNVPMIVSSCDLLSSISSSRVITSVPGGSIASIRACTSSRSAPSSMAMSTPSNWSGAPSDLLRGRDVPGGERGAGEAVAVAEADEGGDLERVACRCR